MRFYKSVLFLLGLNAVLLLPVALLSLKYLILAFVFLIVLDLFLLFFSGFHLQKKFSFSVFPPEDFYGAGRIFDNLKKHYALKNVQLFKVKEPSYSFFCFQNGRRVFVVLSEDLLEIFSKEDIKCLLSYPFQMARSGDLLFLTIISNFLFLVEKFSYFLNYPLYFFGKRNPERKALLVVLVLKTMSFMTKGIFEKADRNFSSTKGEKGGQALILWSLDSLMRVKNQQISSFLAPLFLMNPLTDSVWESYISLQPLIKDRVKGLTGIYPP